METGSVRQRWTQLEPVHAVVYFSPEIPEADAALGLRGFWMSYFAGRAAPLGPVGAEPVIATFYNFAPDLVRRALPDAWRFASPEAVLATRLATVGVVLERLWGAAAASPEVRELAELAGQAAAACPIEGRTLAAAWSAVTLSDRSAPAPSPALELWLACTVLREHRGDGHVAALVAAGVDGCEVHVLQAAAGVVVRANQLRARAWTDADWETASDRLAERGLLDGDRLSAAGTALLHDVEATTDRLAEVPWRALGAAGSARFDELVAPLSAAITDRALIPYPNPMGLPSPRPA